MTLDWELFLIGHPKHKKPKEENRQIGFIKMKKSLLEMTLSRK